MISLNEMGVKPDPGVIGNIGVKNVGSLNVEALIIQSIGRSILKIERIFCFNLKKSFTLKILVEK